MADVLVIDFETRSGADLKKVGPDSYAAHPSTVVLCAVLARATGPLSEPTVTRWFPGDPVPEWAIDHIRAGAPVIAHNAGFERAICDHVLPGWPEIGVRQWVDTAAMAASVSLPRSLAGLGAALGCAVQKDSDGHQLMLVVSNAANPDPTRAQLDRLAQYCELDVRATLEIYWRLPKQGLLEARVRAADAAINSRGFAVDAELVRGMARIVKARKNGLAELLWESTGDLLRPTAVPPLIRWLTEQGIAVPTKERRAPDGTTRHSTTLDRDSVVALLARPDLPASARVALEARLEGSKLTSLAKLSSVTARLSPDGRLRGSLVYCGAHTGRWSSVGFQIHNLPRCKNPGRLDPLRAAIRGGSYTEARACTPDVLAGMSECLRSLIVAPRGSVLLGADYNAIEARVLAWLAGQEDVLSTFAEGRDIYLEDARRIGSEDRDGLGKVQRLGLGYGMGPVQFLTAAEKYGVRLDPGRARQIVQTWRAANAQITAFWSDLEDAFMDCIGAQVRRPVGDHVVVIGDRSCVRVQLPSGRTLHYWRPSVTSRTRTIRFVDDEGTIRERETEVPEIAFFRGDWTEMVRDTTYSGKIAENVTQAVARDVLASAILGLEDCGFPVVAHVHDSVVAEVPESDCDVDLFAAILRRPAHWCRTLPLLAKPYTSEYFRG